MLRTRRLRCFTCATTEQRTRSRRTWWPVLPSRTRYLWCPTEHWLRRDYPILELFFNCQHTVLAIAETPPPGHSSASSRFTQPHSLLTTQPHLYLSRNILPLFISFTLMLLSLRSTNYLLRIVHPAIRSSCLSAPYWIIFWHHWTPTSLDMLTSILNYC